MKNTSSGTSRKEFGRVFGAQKTTPTPNLNQFLVSWKLSEINNNYLGPSWPDIWPDFWSAARRHQQKYGDLVHIQILYRHVYICSNPVFLEKILFEETKCVPKQEFGTEGVFLADGHKWKFARTMLQPSFTATAIAKHVPLFTEKAKQFLETIQKTPGVKIIETVEQLLFETICQVGFGYKPSVEKHEFKVRFNEIFEYLLETQFTRQSRPPFMNSLPLRSNQKYFARLKVLKIFAHYQFRNSTKCLTRSLHNQ
jgi:cytochrome P450